MATAHFPRDPRNTVLVLSIVIAFIGGFFLSKMLSAPNWKSSGDGRTIFNVRTGELRFTRSGRSVAEVQEEDEQAAREAAESKNREMRENERLKESIRSHNSRIFHKVKKFVDSHPHVSGGNYANEWEMVTKKFRTNRLLTSKEQQDLLDFLGRVAKKEPYKSDPSFSQAISDLKEWDHTYVY